MKTPDCPYCESIPGVGAGEATLPRTPFDEVLAAGSSVVLTPTIGMLMPGYFLLITRRHVNAFSLVESNVLESTERWLEDVLDTLGEEFGEYLVFEHGSAGDPVSSGTAGCIVHAHLHLIPRAGIRPEVEAQLRMQTFEHLSYLNQFRTHNYALVGSPGRWGVTLDSALPGQWIRRILANDLGGTAEFDWAIDYGTDNLAETLRRLPQLADAP